MSWIQYLNDNAGAITAMASVLLSVLTGVYVLSTFKLVSQGRRLNTAIVFMDIEIQGADVVLVVGNTGKHPARNIRFSIIRDDLPWVTEYSPYALGELEFLSSGIETLAPQRRLKYWAGEIDPEKYFDGTNRVLRIDYQFRNHLGEQQSGSFQITQAQYAGLTGDTFKGPNAGLIETLTRIERNRSSDRMMSNVSRRLSSHCPTCGESVAFYATKCPHCWEPIPDRKQSETLAPEPKQSDPDA